MPTGHIKIWNSIFSRLAIFFTGFLVFAILFSGYLVYRKSSKVILEYAGERIQHSSQLAEHSFYAVLNEVANDIAVISSSQALQNYVNTPSTPHEEDLNQLFRILLENKPAYFQIRLINHQGREEVRCEKLSNRVVKLAESNLQEKGDRTYFLETIQLRQGEFYFSRINLNEEHGIISTPLTPTLRAASPVFTTDKVKYGIVIINVNLKYLYNDLDQLSGPGSNLYLLDKQGQYLYDKDHEKEFAVQTGESFSFIDDFNIQMDELSDGVLSGELKDGRGSRFLYFIKPVTYFRGSPPIYLLATAEKDILLKSARDIRRQSLQTLLLLCLISLLLSWLFVRFFSKKINQVTRAISSYADENVHHPPLPEHRNDEIGLLARSFSKMREKIEQQFIALNQTLEKEKEAKRQRDVFLQNMSHEIRTPLHAIQGLTDLLRKNSGDKIDQSIIKSIERSVKNLSGLVYDVLDHQKIMEGKIRIRYESTLIGELLKDIYDNYQFEAVKKGLTLTRDIEPKLDKKKFQTDPLRLSQIIINLLDNAIKYTEQGKVQLKAWVQEGSETHLIVEVQDTGKGIQPENLSRINDRFFRENRSYTEKYEGYGLGLSIVKQLVLLFGGTFKAKSVLNEGSIFQISIQIYPITPNQIIPILSVGSLKLPELKNRYTILQLDDDLSTLDLFAFNLRVANVNLVQKTGLQNVLDQLNLITPSILISDLMLDHKNIANDLIDISKQYADLPIIIVSALEPQLMHKISSYWFQKPFNIDLLINQIYYLLGSVEFQKLNFEQLYRNYDYDPQRIYQVIGLLETEFESFLEQIEQMEHAFNLSEWESIAHRLGVHSQVLQMTRLHEIMEAHQVSQPSPDLTEEIRNILRFCICGIRTEKRSIQLIDLIS